MFYPDRWIDGARTRISYYESSTRPFVFASRDYIITSALMLCFESQVSTNL